MENKKALDIKYDILYESLHERKFFTVEDAIKSWDNKSSTTYWNLAKLTDTGKLKRIQKGMYSFPTNQSGQVVTPSVISETIHQKLNESGYEFYISGMDVLMRFMLHIPEQYPAIVFVDDEVIEDVVELLSGSSLKVICGNEYIKSRSFIQRNDIQDLVLLYPTRNFTFAIDGYASYEKAFVDLYFETTRRAYPLSLQELARVFLDMIEQGAVHRGSLMKAAHERSIRSEILLIHDVRHMNPSAIKLAEIIRGGEV